jgi:hypothetical protein
MEESGRPAGAGEMRMATDVRRWAQDAVGGAPREKMVNNRLQDFLQHKLGFPL